MNESNEVYHHNNITIKLTKYKQKIKILFISSESFADIFNKQYRAAKKLHDNNHDEVRKDYEQYSF